MSHFSVLVIGEDVDKQLAPYDETLETTPRREYLGVAAIKLMANHYGLDRTDLPALAEKMAEWKACPGGVDAEGLYALTSYNSNAKWDWYEVGGRWTGFFHLKTKRVAHARGKDTKDRGAEISPTRADTALKSEIDFESMREVAEERAREVWRVYAAAIAGTPEPLSADHFVGKVRARKLTVAAAHKAYRAQPRVLAFQKAMEPFLGPFAQLDEFPRSEEDYVGQERRAAVTPFAYVQGGVWHERGEMGWFAHVANERPESEWYEEVQAVLAALPDDTVLTLVDCHV